MALATASAIRAGPKENRPASVSTNSVDDATPAWSTSTYPATSVAGSMLASLTANTITATRTPALGLNGTAAGTLKFFGLTPGDVTLPPEGYQSRFSDSLNRTELEFLPLTNCEVTTLADGQTRRQEFMALSKRHIRVAYPVEPAAGTVDPPLA